jgi:serine/threonine protein kinase
MAGRPYSCAGHASAQTAASVGAAARCQVCPALDISVTLKVLCQMVWGLAHMHARGSVHGDFKFANVMLAGNRDDLTVVIGDFGMASPVGSEWYVPGITAYSPPEMCSAYAGHMCCQHVSPVHAVHAQNTD